MQVSFMAVIFYDDGLIRFLLGVSLEFLSPFLERKKYGIKPKNSRKDSSNVEKS